MAISKKTRPGKRITEKARQVLAYVERRVREGTDWVELSNAVFGMGGKATQAFPNEAERTAFCKSEEYRRILTLMDSLPAPATKGFVELAASANGAISVRLPRSIHAALLAEAKAEGVSLNQLCVSKLVAQLRAVV